MSERDGKIRVESERGMPGHLGSLIPMSATSADGRQLVQGLGSWFVIMGLFEIAGGLMLRSELRIPDDAQLAAHP